MTSAFAQMFNDDNLADLMHNMVTGAAVGASAGGMIGGEDGAVGGTLVEPGGGTIIGAAGGSIIGACVGAIGGMVNAVVTDTSIMFRSDGNPYKGAPGSRSDSTTDDGNPKQTRYYGDDVYPSKDVDYDHDHGQGSPHVHDWNGVNRQPGRAPYPGELD